MYSWLVLTISADLNKIMRHKNIDNGKDKFMGDVLTAIIPNESQKNTLKISPPKSSKNLPRLLVRPESLAYCPSTQSKK